MRDYLLTNERLKPTLRNASSWSLPPVAAQVLYGVRPEFLDAAFDEIETNNGGMQAYLREGLGLREQERARLRELYLQG